MLISESARIPDKVAIKPVFLSIASPTMAISEIGFLYIVTHFNMSPSKGPTIRVPFEDKSPCAKLIIFAEMDGSLYFNA